VPGDLSYGRPVSRDRPTPFARVSRCKTGPPGSSGVYGKKDAFLGPWSGKSIQDWSDKVWEREREILAEARKTETAAIAELEKAVAALDLPSPEN